MKEIPIPTKILDAMSPTRKALVGSTLAKFKELVKNPEAKPSEFFSVLPETGIVALMLASGKTPPELPAVIQQEVKPLRELVSREMPDLKQSSSFTQAAITAVDSLGVVPEQTDADTEKALEPRSIAGVSTMPLLFGAGDQLIPGLRIVLKSDPPGSNYEFFANAEELTSIAAAFIQNLALMMEQRAALAGKGFVKINDPVAVADQIEQMERALQKVRQFAPQFGVLLDGTSKSLPPAGTAN